MSFLLVVLLFPIFAAAQSLTLRSFADSKAPAFATLPLACQNAFNAPLNGCGSTDFDFRGTDRNTCSVSCVNAINTIATLVKNACGAVVADPVSIIGFFQRDQGLPALCKNIAFASSSSANLRQTQPANSLPPPQSLPPVATVTSATLIISSTLVIQTPGVRTTAPGGLIIDGSTPTGSGLSAAQTVGGAGSGGGSPFDGTNFGTTVNGAASGGVEFTRTLGTVFAICIIGLVWL